jgi:hypothetical protein
MNRSNLIMAGLAAAGENASFTPVQVQKLFFLLIARPLNSSVVRTSISRHTIMAPSIAKCMMRLRHCLDASLLAS